YTVERIGRSRSIGEAQHSRNNIQTSDHRATDLARRNGSGESGNKGHSHAALKCLPFASAQNSGAPLKPGPMIAGEDYERVVIDVVILQSLQNLTDTPIQFRDDVAVDSHAGRTPKRVGAGQRYVRERMRHEQEKWMACLLGNELHGLLCISLSKRVQIAV